MASRRDPSRAPTETSANRQCPPRKETQSPSGRCVRRAASSRTYCRPKEREGLKKTRATTWLAFLAEDNRRFGACGDLRIHFLCPLHETQRSYNRILSMLTLYRVAGYSLGGLAFLFLGLLFGNADGRSGHGSAGPFFLALA